MLRVTQKLFILNGYGKGKSFPVHSCAYDPACVSCAFSAGEEVCDLGMMERIGSWNSDG
jgi:hypothetical protein